MVKKREVIQQEAVEALVKNNYTGVLQIGTGLGKSKIAIDAIKKGGFWNILIVSPRLNLRDNWMSEFFKWCKYAPGKRTYELSATSFYLENGKTILVTVDTIQSVYKYPKKYITSLKYDLIIADEIHTLVSEEYGQLLVNCSELGIPIIGLTATPTLYKTEKREFYQKYCPIIYTYLNEAKDGITNSTKYIIYKYDLTDNYLVEVKTKTKSFMQPEAKRYKYLNEQVELTGSRLIELGASQPFASAIIWKDTGDSVKKTAAFAYMRAIRQRKEFLGNLISSYKLASVIRDYILESPENKLLVFSEYTHKCDMFDGGHNVVHSNSEIKDNNSINIKEFNEGKRNVLYSVNSLTLGLNLVGVNNLLFESFNSSKTSALQKLGRAKRLSTNDLAIAILLVPKNTKTNDYYEQIKQGLITEENSIEVSNWKEFTEAYQKLTN